jgi:hypothetical protein
VSVNGYLVFLGCPLEGRLGADVLPRHRVFTPLDISSVGLV